MKRYFLLFAIVLGSITIFAQDKDFLMFEDFCISTIKFKNQTTTKVLANYDMGRQKMLFKENGVVMELVRTETIDSICFGERVFVPYNTNLLEVINLDGGTFYINWHIKEINVGSKGIYGDMTLGTVKNLYTTDVALKSNKTYSPDKKDNTNIAEVYREKNNNEYMIFRNNKFIEINSVKQLCKQFPEKELEIKRFAKENKIEFSYVDDVLKLMKYCFSGK